MCQHYFFS